MPPGWAVTRARILARDPICRRCHQRASAEVHHLEPGREDDSALAGVCRACHVIETARQSADARRMARP
jgi:5-methylcytosine-specific restriction endonuclease McrA